MEVYLAVAAGVGWILAGTMLGLWLGERGRRKDVQWQSRTLRPKHAEAGPTRTVHPEEKPGAGIMSLEAREQLILDTMQETGCSRKDAERDTDAMLQAFAMQGPITPD